MSDKVLEFVGGYGKGHDGKDDERVEEWFRRSFSNCIR
jgi:hypothetical protein